MKKFANRLLCFTTVFVMCFMFKTAVLAQGTTSISVSKSSVGVGDTTVVSVTASSSGTVTVKYTASLLNFIDCTASGFSYQGNTVTFSGTEGDIKFKAIAEGKACIIVSSSSCTGSSTTISVGNVASESANDKPKEEAKPQEETPEVTEETSESTETAESQPVVATGTKSGSLNSDGGFDIDGVSYVVSERYSDSEIPKGFKKTTLTIGQSTYNELTNGNVTLLYLKPADNTEGKGEFYIYSENTGTVAKLSMLGSANQYVMIATATEKPNPNMAESSFSTDKGEFTGYNFAGSDFYYVYGCDENGENAWYVYDTKNNTVSRADEAALKMAVQSSEGAVADDKGEDGYSPIESYQKKLEKLRLIVSALIIVCVVLVFIIINLLIKKNKAEEDDIFDNDEQPIKKKKKSRNADIFSSKSEDDIFDNSNSDDDYDSDYQEDEEMSDEEYVSDKLDESVNSSSNHRTTNSKSGFDIMDLNDL